MRPGLLNDYFADIESLPGIGKRNRLAIERLAGARVRDLLFHVPTGLIDRRYRPQLQQRHPVVL